MTFVYPPHMQNKGLAVQKVLLVSFISAHTQGLTLQRKSTNRKFTLFKGVGEKHYQYILVIIASS